MINQETLTERFDDACVYARSVHKDQFRKGTTIPYISHLLGVASLVLEDGGDEDQVIAALLHDTAEDHGGQARLDDIEKQFGKRVADIVAGCSDTLEYPKPPWHPRKQKYLDHLRCANQDVRKVSVADKLHNARTILLDLREKGDETWERFSGRKDGTLWYYCSLVEVFMAGEPSPLINELARVVRQIERHVENSRD